MRDVTRHFARSAHATKQVPAAQRGNRRIMGGNIDLECWSGVEFVVDIERPKDEMLIVI